MTTHRLSSIVPVAGISVGVRSWALALGREPTFVGGDRWAQFDHEGTRLSLALIASSKVQA